VHGRGAPTAVPSIIGHESVGRVFKLGNNVKFDAAGEKLGVGDRIVYTYFAYCGRCYYCMNKQATLCENRLALSGGLPCDKPPHFNGAFAEYVYLRPGMAVFKAPDELSDSVLAPINCSLSTVFHGAQKIGVRAGDVVLIQGAGGLGIYAVAMAREMGASTIIVTDFVEKRLQLAKEFGADWVVNGTEFATPDSRINEVKKIARAGVDVAFEFTGVADAFREGLGMLRKGGRYLVVGGLASNSIVQLDVSSIVLSEFRIEGNMNYEAWVLPRVLKLLSRTRGKYPYEKIVTHKLPLEKINEAFKLADSRECLRVGLET
jgi:threonine dehydrogenase-like Zn-dependent dehydrogenase